MARRPNGFWQILEEYLDASQKLKYKLDNKKPDLNNMKPGLN